MSDDVTVEGSPVVDRGRFAETVTPWADPFRAVPVGVPVYTWNLAGYAMGHAASGPHRHTFGGLSDAAFRLIPLVEAGRAADWPWCADDAPDGPVPDIAAP